MNSMSFGVSMSNDFKVDVTTTNNRGATPEEVAHRCTIQSDRTTVYNAIKDAGHPELAEYIRKM
mgnify:CR=1 FL=1